MAEMAEMVVEESGGGSRHYGCAEPTICSHLGSAYIWRGNPHKPSAFRSRIRGAIRAFPRFASACGILPNKTDTS